MGKLKREICTNVDSNKDDERELTIISSTNEIVHLSYDQAMYLKDQLGQWMHDHAFGNKEQHDLEIAFEEEDSDE